MVVIKKFEVKVLDKETRRGILGERYFLSVEGVDNSVVRGRVRIEVSRQDYKALDTGDKYLETFYSPNGRSFFPTLRGAEDTWDLMTESNGLRALERAA